jgi:chromosome partitioning related protein ParA
MPAKTYGVICTKGEVGKTTTCANIGGILADMNQRVLLIDCDPQQSLSRIFKLSQKAPFGLTQLYKSASAEACISKTEIKNLDIVLNDDPKKDGQVETFLRESVYHFHNLREALNRLNEDYDYIIIDTQCTKCCV